MTDWTSGYVADLGYTYGYYKELNPLRARLPLLAAGIAPPAHGCACELGFGQGLSLAMHASAGQAAWWGTDFLPAQSAFAQSLVDVSGVGAHLFDQSFEEFLARDDLPRFDFIGLHGVWSWVSAENRALIRAFIRRQLAPGGILYLSYNTQVGWARMMPLRRLLTQHYQLMGAPGASAERRIRDALSFAARLLDTQPLHVAGNPSVATRLRDLLAQDPRYLAHEYFNRDWAPMDFADLAEQLAEAKLEFASSAHYLDLIEAINLTPAQQALLAGIESPALRETARDFCVDKAFRKDYWVKGARRLTPLQQIEALRGERVVMTRARALISLEVAGPLGVADLQAGLYLPILEVLADHRPHALGEIEAALAGPLGIGLHDILQAVLILAHRGDLQAARQDAAIAAARPHTARLNAALMDRARGDGQIYFLASPVTGGGVEVSRFQQLFLLAWRQGLASASALARFVWTTIEPQGEGVMKDGQILEGEAANLAELEARAAHFLAHDLPWLQGLQVVLPDQSVQA